MNIKKQNTQREGASLLLLRVRCGTESGKASATDDGMVAIQFRIAFILTYMAQSERVNNDNL